MRQRNAEHPTRGLTARVEASISRRGLISPEESVLVALSSGPDSTALVAAMAELRDAGRVGEVRALHVDHGLRAGGDDDARCARETCERLGVPFESIRVEVGAGNVQAAARRARYRALRDAATRHGAARIATGHTLSDQAETFLMRALRGAGARGLSSIPPRRGPIVRPLIDVAREEVIAFLEERGLRWREDPTNRSPRYARNAVRLSLVPVLRRLEPRFERALARAADLLRDDERALSRRARSLISERGSVDLASLAVEPRAVRRRVVRTLWRPAAPGARSLAASQVEAILALCGRGRPGRLSLQGGIEARVAYGRLSLLRARPAATPPNAVVEVAGPGSFRLGDLIVDVAGSPGGGAPPPFPLLLRGRRPGDRIRPLGAPGSKKLKAWLIDRKVPRERRDALAVLADAHGNVLALPEMGVRCVGAGALAVTVRRASDP